MRRLPAELGVVDLPDGLVRLPAGTGLDTAHPAYLAERLTTLDGDVRLRVQAVDAGVRAGLGLRYSSTAHLSATIDGASFAVEVVSRSGVPVRAEVAVEGTTGTVTLSFTAMQAVVMFEPDGAAPVTLGPFDIRGLCTASDGGFVGLTYGALAIGATGAATCGVVRE